MATDAVRGNVGAWVQLARNGTEAEKELAIKVLGHFDPLDGSQNNAYDDISWANEADEVIGDPGETAPAYGSPPPYAHPPATGTIPAYASAPAYEPTPSYGSAPVDASTPANESTPPDETVDNAGEKTRYAMSDAGKRSLSNFSDEQLADRFDDYYWNAEAINAFAAEFKRRGKDLSPEQQKVLADAITEARAGKVSPETAAKAKAALTGVPAGSGDDKKTRYAMSDAGKKNLSKLSDEQLADRFDDYYWNAEALNAFAAEFKRRGKDLTPEQKKVLDDAVAEARAGQVPSETAVNVREALTGVPGNDNDNGSGGDKKTRYAMSDTGKKNLSKLSDEQLADHFDDYYWNADAINAFDAEFKRRGKDLTAEQKKVLDDAVLEARKGQLTSETAAKVKETLSSSTPEDERKTLYKLDDRALIDRFDDKHWDAETVKAFEEEIKRRGTSFTEEQHKELATIIDEAHKGKLSQESAVKLGNMLGSVGVVAIAPDSKLSDVSNQDLVSLLSNSRYGKDAVDRFKAELERRANGHGGIDDYERKVIDETIAKARTGNVSKEDAMRAFAVTGLTFDLLLEATDNKDTWTPDQRKVITEELERRGKNDVAGIQPGEAEAIEKLKKGESLTTDERTVLWFSLPDNAGDTRSGAQQQIERNGGVYAKQDFGDISPEMAAVWASTLAYMYTEKLSEDGQLTEEEKAAIDGYTNAIRDCKKDTAEEWERLQNLLPKSGS